jgi:sugar/nucleoside kinase (ribokinase family)
MVSGNESTDSLPDKLKAVEYMTVDVAGIDNLPVVDYLLRIDKLPRTNEIVIAADPSWQCGGKAATAMAALGVLNARAGIICVVGSDRMGAYCLEDFKRYHVDVSQAIVDPGKTTTLSICLAEQSRKSIFIDSQERQDMLRAEQAIEH